MSTKVSIAHGDSFHLYQEIFEGEEVFLQVEGVNYVRLENGSLSFSIDPNLLTEIATKWLKEKDLFLEGGFFQVSGEAEEALSEYLKATLKSAVDKSFKS